MPHKLHDDAIFVADAHYQVGVRESFYNFLLKIQSQEIATSQLIMIGDMFDLLVGTIDYTCQQNKKLIDLLNSLSSHIEILYFEGNHDFDLQRIFKDIKVIPYTQQPLLCTYHDKTIVLSHGDLHQSFGYKFYTSFIRHAWVLKILNFFDTHLGNFISKNILKAQKNKDICKKIDNFAQIIKQKSKKYDIASNRFDVICEGHYHMDEDFCFEGCQYRILSSYACAKRYFTIDFNDRIVFIPKKG